MTRTVQLKWKAPNDHFLLKTLKHTLPSLPCCVHQAYMTNSWSFRSPNQASTLKNSKQTSKPQNYPKFHLSLTPYFESIKVVLVLTTVRRNSVFLWLTSCLGDFFAGRMHIWERLSEMQGVYICTEESYCFKSILRKLPL